MPGQSHKPSNIQIPDNLLTSLYLGIATYNHAIGNNPVITIPPEIALDCIHNTALEVSRPRSKEYEIPMRVKRLVFSNLITPVNIVIERLEHPDVEKSVLVQYRIGRKLSAFMGLASAALSNPRPSKKALKRIQYECLSIVFASECIPLGMRKVALLTAAAGMITPSYSGTIGNEEIHIPGTTTDLAFQLKAMRTLCTTERNIRVLYYALARQLRCFCLEQEWNTHQWKNPTKFATWLEQQITHVHDDIKIVLMGVCQEIRRQAKVVKEQKA